MLKVMKCIKQLIISGLLIGSLGQTAFAVPILSFNNAQDTVSQVANIGDIVTFELWFSGLESEDVGGFDFLLSFNESVSGLNAINANFALTEFDIFDIFPAIGNLDFSGVSFLSGLSAQADAFMLATMSFVANRGGVSDVVISPFLISDAFAAELDVQVFGAQIIVNEGTTTPVPAPASWHLFLLGVLLLVARHRTHCQK
ncbi:hypothetical protein [Paraglaciecola polaris]|uniref:Uncharacterized protein n=1 Tax=Paraglaciecola polaris LMG 21857 TaxID=1129793 RepID=K6YKD6_9ALTE|nr:hypothetical protein [Paraglaciecola polaris]GAC33174.1 hypothetical protein GPLA_2269 [Paraglaciecola polaris LMG 21857]